MLKPLRDRVLIRRQEAETMTAGGLHIPERARDKPFLAVVEAAGGGRVLANGDRISLDVKNGDTVIVGKYVGVEFPDDRNCVFVREDEILAVVEATSRAAHA